MVLCVKPKKFIEVNVDENFYLGPPDFSKFTPAHTSNFASRREIWLLSDHLVKQTTINTVQQLDRRLEKSDESIITTVIRCENTVASTPQEKKEMFIKSLTNILSCIYAVFVVTLGVVIYIGEIMTGSTPFAELFSIYLVVTGIAYITFLYSDMRQFSKLLKISEEIFFNRYVGASSEPVSMQHTISLGSLNWTSLSEPELVLPHHYCFLQNRHVGSFYLKLGAAGFCLGHLIHSGLLISYQVTFLIADPYVFYNCANTAALILDFLYPTYSFIQLFFIFKYSNVIINKNKVLARFAIMHCIGANVCFWIWTILRETVDSLSHKKTELPVSLHHLKISSPDTYSNDSEIMNSETCQGPNHLSKIFGMFTPYLYPFTIEYSILVAGVMFIIWQNIGAYTQCTPSPGQSDISNLVFHADCHSSNKGLFAGLIVLVGSFLSIILFFVAMNDKDYLEAGLMVNSGTELAITLLMTVTVIPAYKQITKLDINMRSSPCLDELLLFTCIPAFFVQVILSIIPSWNSKNYINLATILLQVIQIMIQTPFIIDGLKRCANSKKLRKEKPGRELLMFLIVCNVTIWITETFEIKSHTNFQDQRSLYYGAFLWSSITHLTFPLTMFYRFHSSVCMVDIWKSAYSKE